MSELPPPHTWRDESEPVTKAYVEAQALDANLTPHTLSIDLSRVINPFVASVIAEAITTYKDQLRAKVEALPARGVVYPYDLDSLVPETLLYRADVLALLDGSTDE